MNPRKNSNPKSGRSNIEFAKVIIKDIIRLEKKVWKTAQKREADAFKELVPSDAIMIFQSGIIPQPEYVATMRERTISRYELRNFRGFMPNPKTVILYYEALRLGDEAGKLFPMGTVIEATTWIKRGHQWVAVLNQETPLVLRETRAKPHGR
jgi:hypothetical protein